MSEELKEYPKIETVYEREPKGKRNLLIGQFHNPIVEYLKDLEWEWTEKVNGTNIRIYWNGHKFSYWGRTNDAQLPQGIVMELVETFGTREMEQIFEQKFGETEVVLFCEGYGGTVQKGYYKGLDKEKLILFDVKIGDFIIKREGAYDIAEELGLACVRDLEIKHMTLMEAIEYVKSKPISKITERVMEGLVGTPKQEIYDKQGKRIIVKILSEDFK